MIDPFPSPAENSFAPARRSLRKAVEDRIVDWLRRLDDLYRDVEIWAMQEGWSVDRSQSRKLYADVMRYVGFPARRQPVLRLDKRGTGFILLCPKGPWMIDANGLVEVYTGRGVRVLVDQAQPLEEAQWMLVGDRSALERIPFIPEALAPLV